MRLRIYTVSQKYVKNKHGEIGVYKKRIKKWIKSSQPYKPRKRGLQKLSIHSTRFGFLDLYNRKEQQELICPSGYSISQCFNVLRKLWYAYRRAIGTDMDIDKMKKYAKAIQDVQNDMGIKTASFPHLGLYGDALILNAKNGMRRVFENHSALKKKREEYEMRQMKNAIKIQETLQKPNKLNGEAIVTIADDVFPYEKEDNEITVPQLLEPDDEKEEITALVDNIPFRKPHRRRLKRNGESTLTIADDEIAHETIDAEIEDTVPHILEPEGDEKILVISDDIPFRS
jgi:hypothetical protein